MSVGGGKFRVSHAEGKSIANLTWWELFHDENLQRLINQALLGNKELKQAEASIEEMQARLKIAFMDFLPTLEADANAPVMGTLGEIYYLVFQHLLAILGGPL